jgi:adenylate cyclase
MKDSQTQPDDSRAAEQPPAVQPTIRRRSWPLQLAILRFVTLLVTATSLCIGLAIYWNTRRAAAVLAERLTHELTQRTEERAANLLQGATKALQDTRDWAEDDPAFGLNADKTTDDANWRSRARLLLHVLQANPNFNMVHFGDRYDHFVGAARDERGAVYITHRWIRPDGRTEWRDYLDPTHLDRPTASVRPGAEFRVMTRPWYELARRSGRLTWSPIYTFAGAQTPGVTAALPVKDGRGQVIGVFGIDFELRGLNAFVRKLEQERGYHVYLLTREGRVVAQGAPRNEPFRQTSEGYELPTAAAGGDPLLRSAYELSIRRQQPGDGVLLPSFTAEGKRWVGSVTSFSPGEGLTWQALVVLPETAVLDVLNQNSLLALAICLAVLAIALTVAAFLAAKIARPLRAFAAEMQQVGDFVLSDKPSPDSSVVEVQMMGRALDRMKASLRSYEKYVPSEVVRLLHIQGRTAQLGGETARLTLLFADIVGFSTLSEQLEPAAAVEALSQYLELAEDVISGNGGIVDKYDGDSVIAFWGAPIHPSACPEQDACKAALEIQRAVQELNVRRERDSLPPLDVRIGLHTGAALVGNIGSPERMNYTAIGDAVNVASRLEQLNRIYGTRIMVSEATLRAVDGHFTGRELDVVAVKGRQQGVRVFELLDRSELDGSELNESAGETQKTARCLYAEGLRLYRLREWEQAAGCFEQCLALDPHDTASQLMAERCVRYAVAPPPPDWNGIYVASAK